jgi:outer membrane immunogenic protein
MKRNIALPVVFLALLSFAQFAAAGPEQYNGKDMKTVQPVVQQQCNWTGFYIGAHVGYGWNDLKWTDTDTSTFSPGSPGEGPDLQGNEVLVEQSADGVIAGGQIGYNYQFGHFVIGAEGDFSYSNVSDSSSVHTESFTNDFETNSQWMGTFGLRLGYAWSHFLFYAKGAGAVTHQDYSLRHTVLDEGSGNHVDRFSADNTWVSPLVGAGIEYAINCHWSVKVEYNYLFLGKNNITGTNVEADTGPESESYEVDSKHQNTVRFGLNYKF